MHLERGTHIYLETLERQNHRLRTLLGFGVLLLGCVFFMGQIGTPPKVLTAQKFTLVDSGGRTKAELYSEEHGEKNTVLVLYSPSMNTLRLQAGDATSLMTIEQTYASAGIVATQVDHLGLDTNYGAKSTSITSHVEFQLHAHGGSSTGSSKIDVTAGPVDYEVGFGKGWKEMINAPVLKLSRGKREMIFATPEPSPLPNSGH
jgi:hypothetical protein